MTDPVAEDIEQVDPLELSDEEFAALAESSATTQEDVSTREETPDEGENSNEETFQSEETPEADPGTETEESGREDNTSSGTDTLDTLPEKEEIKEEAETANENTNTNEAESTSKEGSADEQVVDYKAEYEKLLAPFKANGMEMQAQSVDDAIQLMQMGAGFHKKMAALKPAMRQMKLLEKHDLLDDEKLNYLIDLSKKNPEAIQKLLKDSNIDPLDIDVKADNNYKPTSRKVSDTEIALDEVLNDIRETPTFQRTLNVVSSEWDESSQNAIATEPQIITTINGHMQDGTFDAVMQRVEYERSLGRLKGVSDIQAYMQTGNAMADEGKLQRAGAPQTQVSPVSVQSPQARPSKQDVERKLKKRAASPTKVSKTPVASNLPDPLEMSDEDFAKLDINKYLKS